MDPFKAEAVRLGLRKMFKGSYFDICTVKACADAAGVTIPGELKESLHAMHCVHWSDMTSEMRQEVVRRVVGIFSEPGMDLSDLEKPYVGGTEKAVSDGGLFRRLLGRGLDA